MQEKGIKAIESTTLEDELNAAIGDLMDLQEESVDLHWRLSCLEDKIGRIEQLAIRASISPADTVTDKPVEVARA